VWRVVRVGWCVSACNAVLVAVLGIHWQICQSQTPQAAALKSRALGLLGLPAAMELRLQVCATRASSSLGFTVCTVAGSPFPFAFLASSDASAASKHSNSNIRRL
jgi:hypothetical protein